MKILSTILILIILNIISCKSENVKENKSEPKTTYTLKGKESNSIAGYFKWKLKSNKVFIPAEDPDLCVNFYKVINGKRTLIATFSNFSITLSQKNNKTIYRLDYISTPKAGYRFNSRIHNTSNQSYHYGFFKFDTIFNRISGGPTIGKIYSSNSYLTCACNTSVMGYSYQKYPIQVYNETNFIWTKGFGEDVTLIKCP